MNENEDKTINGGQTPEAPEAAPAEENGGQTPEAPEAAPAEENGGQFPEAPEAAPAEENGGQAPEASEAANEGEEPKAPATPDWKGMYQRTMADFDNFRKRTLRDREELFKQAAAEVIKDTLPTVDNLALALDKAADRADDPFVTGVKLVYEALVKMLAGHGAKPIDSLGEPFDANFHEALATLPSAEVEEGKVMNEVKRGWLLNDKLLRAAQVVVSAGKADGDGTAADGNAEKAGK